MRILQRAGLAWPPQPGSPAGHRVDLLTDLTWAALALGVLTATLAYTLSFLVPLEYALPVWWLAGALSLPSAVWLAVDRVRRSLRRR